MLFAHTYAMFTPDYETAEKICDFFKGMLGEALCVSFDRGITWVMRVYRYEALRCFACSGQIATPPGNICREMHSSQIDANMKWTY